MKEKIVLNLLMLFIQRISKYGYSVHSYNDYHRGMGASAFQENRLYFNCHCFTNPCSLSIAASTDSCSLKNEMYFSLKINDEDTYDSCKERFDKMFEETLTYVNKVIEPHKEDRREF